MGKELLLEASYYQLSWASRDKKLIIDWPSVRCSSLKGEFFEDNMKDNKQGSRSWNSGHIFSTDLGSWIHSWQENTKDKKIILWKVNSCPTIKIKSWEDHEEDVNCGTWDETNRHKIIISKIKRPYDSGIQDLIIDSWFWRTNFFLFITLWSFSDNYHFRNPSFHCFQRIILP